MRRIIFFACIAFALGCTKNGGDSSGNTGGGGGGGTNPACSGTPGARFTAAKAVITANCAVSGCHLGTGASAGLNFSDNCVVVAQASRIKVRAVDQAGTANQMPPPPMQALSTADRQAITAWVNAGGRITD